MKHVFIVSSFLIWLLFFPVTVLGQAVVVNGFAYTFSGNEATVIGTTTPTGPDLVIPSTVEYSGVTYDVTTYSINDPLAVGKYGFRISNSVTAPSIKHIVGHPANSLEIYQPANQDIVFMSDNLTKIDFPELETITNCGFINNCSNLTTLNLPKLKTLDKVYFLEFCPALTKVSLPSLTTATSTFHFFSDLLNLEELDLPNLESLVGDPVLVCFNIYNMPKLSKLNVPKLKEVKCGTSFTSLPLNTFHFAKGCKMKGNGLFRGLDGSTIAVNGVTEFSGTGFSWNSNLRKIVMPDLQILSNGGLFHLSQTLKVFEAPNLTAIRDFTFDPGSTAFESFITGELTEITNSSLFNNTPVKELRVSSRVIGNGYLHLTKYPTVIHVIDRGPVEANTTIFSDMKGGRLIVPEGKAGLCVNKWNIDISKTMVYSPLKLSKITAAAKYASGSITDTESSTTQDGNTYVNYYDLRNAMLLTECEDGAVLGPNDAGFTSATISVSEYTSLMDACQVYTAGTYTDTSTPSVGDLTLDAVTPTVAGTVQGFGTLAANLYKGLNKTVGGFLFKGNTESFTTIYAPYVSISVTTPTTNYLKAGNGATITTKTNGNNYFYWHPGDATYNEGFYVSRGVTIPEARAYLAIPFSLSANAKSFRIFFHDGVATNIVSPNISKTNEVDNSWYTISGTRLSAQPTTQGIYLHGGKKILIK